MPSFSPNETGSNFLGLSPNSYKAFQQREETRFNTLSQEFEDVLEEQDNVTDDDTGTDTEEEEEDKETENINHKDPWGFNSDEEIYFSSSLEEERIHNDVMGEWKSNDDENESNCKLAKRHISEEELIFPIEELLVSCRKNQSAKDLCKVEAAKTPPFWYENESSDHVSKIVQFYTNEILHDDDNLCPKLRDCRRLPKFIGRIQRTPIKGGTKCLRNQSFVTLDKIDIFQRDIRQCGSYTTKLNTVYTISTWDNDGMPHILEKLENENVCRWRRKAIKGFPISYIYCLPVWQSRTEFIYSVEPEEHEVGYANQPWNYTSYLPKELLMNNLEDLN
jgi:hypothetical protein